jgi:hypothetical protein
VIPLQTGSNRQVIVEVLGRYSNLCDQRERLRNLLQIVPEGPPNVNLRTSKQFQNRLEPAEIHLLKQAYRSGATLRDLARDFEIHRTTAMELLERAGIARRGKGPSESEVLRAIHLYREGRQQPVSAASWDSVQKLFVITC